MHLMIKSLAVVGLVLTGFATSAHAEDEVAIEDYETIPFYVENESSYYRELHYAGQRGWVEAGVDRHDFAAPDCLILSGAFTPITQDHAAAFLNGLEVKDQLGFSGDGEGEELAWTTYQGNYVYFLTGLSLFVDGIGVKTRTAGVTLYQHMVNVFGAREGNLSLKLSRGCKAAGRP